MAKKNAPEFYWSEKRQQYRKRFKGADGKWHDAWGDTKAETRAKVQQLSADIGAAKSAADDPLVFEYCKTWYKLNAPGKSLKIQQGYRTAINRHICPVIGGKPVSDVTSDDIKAVMASVSSMSNESQKRILSILKRVFRSAVAAGLIDRTPVTDVRASGKKTAEKIPLTREQQRTLMDGLADAPLAHTFCAIALWAGLRREEVLGLMWDCVHLDAETPYLSVRRSCRWVGNHAEISEELKSAAAKRDVPIPPQLGKILAKQWQNEGKDNPNRCVICDQNKKPLSEGSFRRMWKKVTDRMEHSVSYRVNGQTYKKDLKVGDTAPYTGTRILFDFDVKPHQLRHTYITELILAGANVKTVQYLAGHGDVTVTLRIYTHLTENTPTATMGAVLKAFG